MLPPLYLKWMAELLGGEIPEETRATCSECAMRPKAEGEEATGGIFFDPVIKCCTYIPILANFLVGRILADAETEAQPGKATVATRIERGIGVTPLGLKQPPVYSLLYESSDVLFGRSRALRCPHYLEESGHCGIWRNRSAVCATWYCKHSRGKVGRIFWVESLLPLLDAAERRLAQWCVLELCPEDDPLRYLVSSGNWADQRETVTSESLDNRVNEEQYARQWGAWRGRENEFFLRCAELVNPLSWAEVERICGAGMKGYSRLTIQAYRKLLSSQMPAALEVAPMQLAAMQNGLVRISTYSTYDPLDVPGVLMNVLGYFNGGPIEETLAAIEDETGLAVDRSLILKMIDFEMLAPPKPKSHSGSK